VTKPGAPSPLRYQLDHQESLLGVAYFTPKPAQPLTLAQCLEYVQSAPNDEFMRAHVRPLLAASGQEELSNLYANASPVIQSLILETILLTPALCGLWDKMHRDAEALAQLSPQIFLRSASLPDHELHARASRLLAASIFEHRPLPDDMRLLPFAPAPEEEGTDLAALRLCLSDQPACPRIPARQTCALAMERLYGLGILDGPEMRHHASLAPWGLLRRWRLDRTTRCGSFNHRLEGLMTSYGRGLCLEDAQVSLAMEIVERYSSFADIRDMRISGGQDEEIRLATHKELGEAALDPNLMRLEAPYRGQPLHWMTANDSSGATCFVPVQAVYLFTNLDEIRLFSGLGSTGLASGNSADEAKVSGLLEVIERDAEAVRIFDPSRCFRVQSKDAELGEVLQRYHEQGIDPVFQDLTTELGVPCYKCFVQLKEGGLVKATGAGLSGKRAAISALTETPFPFPGQDASAPGPKNLPVRMLEDLPDYSTGSATGDLALLEAMLRTRGFSPLYANLTKRELRLPVFRAIVPGLEIVSDFDRFTRISPRLWRDVLRSTGKDA
jgi:ribosomal protein S12 methylthiotransferase accessory factor YcaO